MSTRSIGNYSQYRGGSLSLSLSLSLSRARRAVARKRSVSSAFTIVELLIVVVIIAILAAITLVSYKGISNRAKASAVQSTASQATKKLALYAVQNNDSYPVTASLTDASPFLSATGLNQGDGGSSANYQYTSPYPYSTYTAGMTLASSYCLTTTINNVSYYTTSNSLTPAAGACAGHGVNGGGVITNLMTNPSLESNTNNFGIASITLTREIGSGAIGSYRLNVARTAAGDAYFSYTLAGPPPLGKTYTLSFYVWADTPQTLSGAVLFRHCSSAGYYDLGSINSLQVTTVPTQVVITGATSSTVPATCGLQIVGRVPVTNGVPVYYDGFMITEGSNTYTYADGNSAGWAWNGTPNNSTSVGPSL